jgi:hypothetical protein
LAPRLANRPRGGRYGDVAQAIGNTPLVELDDVAAFVAGLRHPRRVKASHPGH